MEEIEIIHSFEKAVQRLGEVLKEKKTTINRDAAIQRFEFTVELAWKVIQKFLKNQEIVCRSPKECLQEAFRFGLIKDDACWLEMLQDRNLTVHTYNEETINDIYSNLPNYLEVLVILETRLKEEMKRGR